MNTKTKHWARITAGIFSLAGYASATSIGSEKYAYDDSGNIIAKSINGEITKFGYDQSNRITKREAPDQSKETTTYDTAGRPIAVIDDHDLQIRSLAYGYGDKVIATNTENNQANFYYNAEGRLVGKGAAGKVSYYTWDGNCLAADSIQAYTNEDHISGGVPVLNSAKSVVISDGIGNTLTIGEQHFDSTAYGEGLEGGRFTGKPFVKELESYVFNHRLYSPGTSRWTSADPSGFPDGENNFSYVNSDPISKVDPTGLAIRSNHGTLYNRTKDCGGSGTTVNFEADGYVCTHIWVIQGSTTTTTEDVISEDRKNDIDTAALLGAGYSVSYVAFSAKALKLPVAGNSTMKLYGTYPRYTYDAHKFISIDSGTAKTGCGTNHTVIATNTAIGAGTNLSVFEK